MKPRAGARTLGIAAAVAAIASLGWSCGTDSVTGPPTASGAANSTPSAVPSSTAVLWSYPTESGSPGSFIIAGSVTQQRACETTTLLDDGRVLVVGGIQRSDLQFILTADVYAPDRRTFAYAGEVGSSPSEYCEHAAAILRDGRVLIAESDGAAQIFDPVSGSFSSTGVMKTARQNLTLTALPDGRALIAGGPLELYDPATGTFSATGLPQVSEAAALLKDGRVLLLGTSAAWLFDPSTGRAIRTGPMNTARFCPAVAALRDGRVLVAGGYQAPPGASIAQYLASAEAYDPASGSFAPVGMASGSPKDLVLLADGRVLALFEYEVELFEPSEARFVSPAEIRPPIEWEDARTCNVRDLAVALLDGSVLLPGDPSLLYWP